MSLVTNDDRTKICSYVANSLRELLQHHDDLQTFVKFLNQFDKVVVFGGFVRGAVHNYLHSDAQEFRDIDLVVVGRLQGPNQHAGNHFGGYRKAFTDGLRVDYWTLESTFAFTKGLFKPSLENLSLTTVFTINACLFDPTARQLFESNAIEAIAARTISFNCKGYLDLYPEFQAFRAVDFAERLGYSLDPEVTEFVRNTLAGCSLQDFIDAVSEHRPDEPLSRLKNMFETYREVHQS
ncbi:MAG: hypothetical protein WAM96_21625 [Candidatus Acidiferrales bacterium]